MWEYTLDAYEAAADSARAEFAPAAVAWRNALDEDSTFELYQGDCIHQNANGIYLYAAVFYSVFTGLSVEGHPSLSFGPTFPPDDLAFMQRIAWATYDSVRAARPIACRHGAPVGGAAVPRLTVRQGNGHLLLRAGPGTVGGILRVLTLAGRHVVAVPMDRSGAARLPAPAAGAFVAALRGEAAVGLPGGTE
jgi:hypothetical protein